MKVPEFVKELKAYSDATYFTPGHRALLKKALSIIESQREALEEIEQRTNESTPDILSEREIIHDCYKIARRELDREVE